MAPNLINAFDDQFYSASCPDPAEVVIAVDFGTTFSGFAYAKISDQLQPLEILDNCKWPGDSKAGAKPYCKNQTSLFYTPNPTKPGHFELQEWGWSAFHTFSKALQQKSMKQVDVAAVLPGRLSTPSSYTPAVGRRGGSPSSSSSLIDLSVQELDALNIGSEIMANKVGFFAHNFKLFLAPEQQIREDGFGCMPPPLPGDLSAERLVVDYLKKLTEFIMEELKVTTSREGFSIEEVQWCLTVPAIWDEQAKQMMRTCAEKAGMVRGPNCPERVSSSPRALQIILEPEAASVYCQNKARANLDLVKGDSILVADVGGGTIDLVVHEILESHPTDGVTQVREAVASYGATGGGSFVDARFFQLLGQKIGCFRDFCRNINSSVLISIYSWWQGIKADFDGPGYTAEFSMVNSALGEAWQTYDKEHGVMHSDDYYQELCLDDTEILSIFDPEVDKVLELIEKQMNKVRVLMVVGGFAGSLYLRKQVFRTFKDRVEEIIIPENPGSAICRGAVQLCMKKAYIKSRISRKTYGICTLRKAEEGDPPELITVDDDGQPKCRRTFSVFVRAGMSVEMDAFEQNSYFPASHGQRTVAFSLYSSPKVYPRYTTEPDAKEEGRFEIDISQDMGLDKNREVEVSMLFGDSLITVSAARRNLGTREKEQALSVTFAQTA